MPKSARVLRLLDIPGIDTDQDLRAVPEALQQPDLGGGMEAGEDAGGVEVLDQLAAELEVELVVEEVRSFEDVAGLLFEIELVVEARLAHAAPSTQNACGAIAVDAGQEAKAPPGRARRPVWCPLPCGTLRPPTAVNRPRHSASPDPRDTRLHLT